METQRDWLPSSLPCWLTLHRAELLLSSALVTHGSTSSWKVLYNAHQFFIDFHLFFFSSPLHPPPPPRPPHVSFCHDFCKTQKHTYVHHSCTHTHTNIETNKHAGGGRGAHAKASKSHECSSVIHAKGEKLTFV